MVEHKYSTVALLILLGVFIVASFGIAETGQTPLNSTQFNDNSTLKTGWLNTWLNTAVQSFNFLQNNTGGYRLNITLLNNIYTLQPGQSLQAVHDAVPEGTIIELDRLNYTFTGLTITKRIILRGHGYDSILRYSGTGEAIKTSSSAITNIVLENFRLINLQKEQGIGINTSEMRRADIRNLWINDFRTGIKVVKYYNNLYNNYISGGLTGIQIVGNQNNIFSGTIAAHNYSSINISGYGNYIQDVDLEEVERNSYALLFSQPSRANYVINPWIESTSARGIGVYFASGSVENIVDAAWIQSVNDTYQDFGTSNSIKAKGIVNRERWATGKSMKFTGNINISSTNFKLNATRATLPSGVSFNCVGNCEIYPNNQFAAGMRLLYSGDTMTIQMLGASNTLFLDNVRVSGTLNNTGETYLGGIKSDGTGKVVCIKSDGALGTCSTIVDVTGACTCG